MSDSKGCPWFVVLSFVLICSLIGGIVYGLVLLKKASNYNQNATKEMCFILDRISTSCSCGNQCIGKSTYEYEAISSDKCGNSTLKSDPAFESCQHESEAKKANTNEICYIIDCDEELFTFDAPDERDDNGLTVVIICSCLLAFMIGILCCGSGLASLCCASLCCEDQCESKQNCCNVNINKHSDLYSI
eukprot:447421_1